jgi:hypothetical protein
MRSALVYFFQDPYPARSGVGEAARRTVASEFSAVRLRDDLAAGMQRGAR